MSKRFIAVLTTLALAIASLAIPTPAQQANLNRVAGRFVASQYSQWRVPILSGSTGTGAYTITLATGVVVLLDGRQIIPFAVTAPITVGSGATQEIVTPTTVSNCTAAGCSITATFTYAHGPGDTVTTGTFGLQEAMNDAAGYTGSSVTSTGGTVAVDKTWNGTDTILYAAVPFYNVSIEDTRRGVPQFWNLASNTTALATPAALSAQAACDATHTFCSDATVVGSASWGGAAYGCITYVDIMGNESICSTTANFTSVASKAIDIGSPAASTGAVGWKPYLSLSGGTYALAYSVPLLTQPTILLAMPVSAGVCTLTTLETTTPACALTNATYNQTGSTFGANTLFTGGAQFTGYPLVSNTLAPNLDSASAQSLNPSNGGHTVYKYVPSNRVGIPGVMTAMQSFPITTAAQTTIGQVAGSIALPPSFMNYVGRTIEVCGMLSKTSTVADTITNIQLWWDSEGSNVTTAQPIQLTNIIVTATLTAAATMPFCQQITTTVASASATGGTILPGPGWMTEAQVAAGSIHFASSNALLTAVGSLNLALNAHIAVVYNHTTGTDGAGVLLINPTVKILN